MNRCISSLSNVWRRIRRARAKVLARIYAQYKRKSSLVRMGECTIYFETYCPSILECCDRLGVIIPVLPARVPNKVEQWFLSWRFGWPWPMRLASYGKKTLAFVATTPEEMAAVTKEIWNASCTNNSPLNETPLSEKPAREKTIMPEIRERAATNQQKRVVNSLPASKPVTVRPISGSSATKPIKQPQESLAVVEGAIMDNSF